MKTSKASSYAMHALMYMVRHATLLPITNKVIARSECIPEKYLAKIFQRLANAKIVASCKKGSGGYLFDRSPEQINVLEILNAMEGNSLFDDCFMRHCLCGGTVENCEIYQLWQDATSKLKEHLSKMSLVDAAWNHPEHYFEHPMKENNLTLLNEKTPLKKG